MAASAEISEKGSLVHLFHDEHALTLREISKGCTVVCLLCKQDFHGPTYCCEECDFILHEACAHIEFPHRIQEHPSHEHPLNLVCDERGYCCSDCGFSMGALTAIATLLPPQDVAEDTIRHFGHEEHPLSSFHVETPLEIQCRFCEQQVSGQVYGCRSCVFLLHEACARLQSLEIQHPLDRQHPLPLLAAVPEDAYAACFACSDSIDSRPAYHCEECELTLHVRCADQTMGARNKPIKDQEEEKSSSCEVKHFSHEHPLTPLHVGELVQSRMECTVCSLNISGAEALTCRDCRFFLHKSCAGDFPKEIQHPLHPQHPRLVLRPKDSVFDCNSCLEYGNEIAFSCEECEFNLHPACALQTLSTIGDGALTNISHSAHEHPLTLAFMTSEKCSCPACDQSTDGIAYCCLTCGQFSLHRSCAEFPLKLEHAFHSQHPLILSEAPASYFFCFGCHEKHEGMAFCCVECEFYIGARCASHNPTLKHPRHEHFLAYCERDTTKQLQCNCCDKRCRYDFYCCMRCNFNLHGDCLDLPPTMNHKCHSWHPLRLYDKFVRGDPHDQHCDYCEISRDPDQGVYRCEECDFSAHIECIIYDYKGEAKGSETWGSDLSSQLNIEIASLKAKIEITRRDLEAMKENLEVSVNELASIESEWKL